MDLDQTPLFKVIASFFKNRQNVLLVSILSIATLLRFSFVDTIPVSLYWDEVSIGYNAYSILQTGKDEYGTPFPYFFRAYDDDKMPVYIYASVLPIFLFGLNEFSVRFISAMSGVLTVLFTYLLIRQILNISNSDQKTITTISLLSAFLLAISPWHIQFSRVGFEANLALLLIVSGIYCYFLSFAKPRVLYLSGILLGLSVMTYRSSFIFVIVTTILFTVFSFKHVAKKMVKPLIGFFLLLLIISSPLLIKYASTGDLRSNQVSIFTTENPSVIRFIQKQDELQNSLLSKILYNRRVAYADLFIHNYLSHFSLQFLFLKGDPNLRHSVSGMGVLYLWEASTILLGIYYLYTRYKKALLIFLIWLFASPLAASIALPTPHALRSLVMLPIPHIFSAFGLFFGFQLMTAKYRKIATVCMSLLIIFFLALFLQKYVTQNKVTASSDWADGYEQLVRVVETYEKSYEKIVVTGYYWQPYAYFLFYKRIDPGLYQRTGSNASFDKYLFAGTDWDRRVSRATLDKLNLEEYSKTSNALIILSPSEYNVQQKYVSKLEEIKNHNGNVVFVIGELRTE